MATVARVLVRPVVRSAVSLTLVMLALGCSHRAAPQAPRSTLTELGYTTLLGSFVAGPDGSSPHALSSGVPFTGDVRPLGDQPTVGPIVVSPDGRREAFWRDCDEGSGPGGDAAAGVWTAASDGSGARRIWAAPGCFTPSRSQSAGPLPKWNRDGTAIAIGVSVQFDHYGVLVVGADGSRPHYVDDNSDRPVLIFAMTALDWSADGRRLAFVDQSLNVVVVPVSGGPVRVVAHPAGEPALTTVSWSPDGRRLLVTVGDRLEAVAVSDGATRTILSAPGPLTSALWSPDGTRVAWTTGSTGIGLANADGSNRSVVQDTARLGQTLGLTSWFVVRAPPGPVAPSSGYWVAAADVGVEAFGDAYRGPTTPARASAPITAIVPGILSVSSQSIAGYTLISAGGQLLDAGPQAATFTFTHHHPASMIAECGNDFLTPAGNFYLYGTDDSSPLAKMTGLTAPVVAAVCFDHDNLVFTADGKVYEQAPGPRSAVGGPTRLLWAATDVTAPVVAAAPDDATGGYWLVGGDGNVYDFDAPPHGSLLGQHTAAPVIGIADDEATGGYWILTADGVVHGFDAPAEPQTAGPRVTAEAIGIAAAPLPTSHTTEFLGQ